MQIKKVKCEKILDSRGIPTIEIFVTTMNGTFSASSPSGTSTGKYESAAFSHKGIDASIFLLNSLQDELKKISFSKFGDLEKIGLLDAIVTTIAAFTIFIVARMISNKLLLGVVSEDLARSSGIKMSFVNLAYLLLVGLVVALGVKFVGTLLMGALVIVPAVAAKNISTSVKQFQLFSALLGVLSVIIGVLIARSFGIASGPVIVISSVTFFILSFIKRL